MRAIIERFAPTVYYICYKLGHDKIHKPSKDYLTLFLQCRLGQHFLHK